MEGIGMFWVYGLPLALVVGIYVLRAKRGESERRQALHAVRESAAAAPVSLHPVINPNRCMGCGACTRACPQGDVLGVVAGQAELINPTHCIGHGRCAESCPTDAITLAIGSEERGVDLPILDESFQTSTPGIFVAGELGGMGLIRNAVQQGREAMNAIAARARGGSGSMLDVVIVGAGPAGFAASLAAQGHGLRYLTLEQDVFGGSIAHHPRGKIIVTEPVDLPVVGKVRIRETSKEWLLGFWDEVRREHGLRIEERTHVEGIHPESGGFRIETTRGTHTARSVLLSVGRRGTPRKLGVPGEELAKVVYRLTDPAQYEGCRVLVVGGGDTAVEAVVALASVEGCRPILAYRGKALSRPRPRNIDALKRCVREKRARVALAAEVVHIALDSVDLRLADRTRREPNDAVIVCAGGELPRDFLDAAGVAIEVAHGVPVG